MPMLTKEMIKQQQMARNAAQFTIPSTPSSYTSSPEPSLSSSPASTSSSLSRSSTPRSRDHNRPNKCWIPSLEEVSRVDPAERARLFARLAREAERDAQNAVPRTPERQVKTRNWLAKPMGYSSVEVGAAALEPIGLPNEHSEHRWDDIDHSAKMEVEYQQLFSEWIVDVPESPVTSSFGISHSTVSEEVITGWTREDEEMARVEWEAKNNKLRQLGYSI